MASKKSTGGALQLRICWGLAALWLTIYVGSSILGESALGGMLWGISFLLLFAILLCHGSLLYGWRGVGAYLAIALAAGFTFEASSIATGFPFGYYVHNVPGPSLFGVTIMAATIYAVVGWYAWIVARSILLDRPDRNRGSARFTTPVIAAFILAGFDYPFDPIGSTIRGMWTFAYPGGQFGVPLSNFLGWIFTGWIIFQALALIEHRFHGASISASRNYWLLPCLIWMAMALQYPLLWGNAPSGITKLGSRSFVTADIYEAALIGSLFTLLLVGMIGVARLCRPSLQPI
ncbi:carotenoid biosynthesis protein [Sphingobium sp.]|uniref:carotenoid biosynthesis protein n=1 Tax=Sphingobium sp. TaxID=1912891 RepID=UPI0028BD8165|nr:carotenoid biosynthesis protein [Sphingobium sp.]